MEALVATLLAAAAATGTFPEGGVRERMPAEVPTLPAFIVTRRKGKTAAITTTKDCYDLTASIVATILLASRDNSFDDLDAARKSVLAELAARDVRFELSAFDDFEGMSSETDVLTSQITLTVPGAAYDLDIDSDG